MDNSIYTELFKNNIEKAEAFDKIAELFYNRNFGSSSKTEVELLMFSIYMDQMIKRYKNGDNTIDYHKCSDYEIGKELGITREKVRNLKVKKQARYPQQFKWQDSLAMIKDDIRYDPVKKKIIIPMLDPNLYNEIRNFIETHGGYIEIQRGANVLQIRIEYFLLLIYEDLNITNKKNFRKELLKELKKQNSNENAVEACTKTELIKQILKVLDTGINCISKICTEMDPSNKLFTILGDVINKMV